ncbi:MAG: DEAD/DEAH box helicase, partial [Phycisphaerales bacterium]|nr:DEAD/DEAH box helicase [Phycisphaerales bacterium]
MKFSALQLAEPIVRAVTDKGYASATDIQAGAIPPALLGRDILGTAQTGTGKTCAFALPILHRLSQSKPAQPVQPVRNKRHDRRAKGRTPRALVLCPTRELATQIHESFLDYGSNLKLGYCVVFGGVSQYHQVRALQRGVDVLIATPGRLKDLVNQGHIDLTGIETLVLDEADRMLDMGFISDIRHIVQLIPGDRQTMLFSATISNSIRRLANDLLDEPTLIETAPEATTVDTIKQRFFMIPQQKKFRLLITLLNQEKVDRALIFTKTKHKADRVARWLQRAGIRADAIHSNKTQSARNAAMRSFREGNVNVLVATDIASRGIDVDNITHVLNFDVPIDPETYVHRIGRTARAGASGTAITFYQANEKQMLRSIERRANITLPPAEQLPRLEEMPELSPDATSSENRTDERRRSPRRNGQDDHRNDRKGRFKKHAGGTSKGGYAPRENRDGDSDKPGGYKKKDFKKNKYQKPSGSTDGHAPRENRDGDSGGYKKKFKKNTGGYDKGGYVPRDDRDGDSAKPGGYKKKKFKKNAGGYNKGGYVPRDDRDGDS